MQPSAVCLQMRLKADMGPPILYSICYMQNVIVLYIYIYILLDTVSSRCLSADVCLNDDFGGNV